MSVNRVDSRENHEPPMRERIGGWFESRAVSRIDLGCKIVAGLLGTAALAMALFLIVRAVHNFGWTSETIPLYGFLGTMAFAGTVLAIYSFRWLREEHSHRKEFWQAQRQAL